MVINLETDSDILIDEKQSVADDHLKDNINQPTDNINDFGDKKSALGYKWHEYECDHRQLKTIQQKFDLSYIIAKLILNRGIALENVADFLNPTLRSMLPDPMHFLDMEKASKYIINAIEQQKKIAVFGDYDVDGATSSALLYRFFQALNIDILIYIPDRMKEGYGPNEQAFSYLKEQEVDVVITVDCGIVAFESLDYASKIGLDVIVLDHHLGNEKLPKAVAVVNPNRLDEQTQYRNIAAVAVSYFFVIAINKLLREEGFYSKNNISPPNLLDLLDFVALGTICDVMPITSINRAFVKQGLKIMGQRNNLGLKVLADIAGIDQKLIAYHCGFVLGPRINAGGRVGQASLGSQLLTTDKPADAYLYANQLEYYNKERKEIEQEVLSQAIYQIEQMPSLPTCIMTMGANWHQGVIGIVASRIKDLYDRPVIIMSVIDDVAKASARSVKNIDIGAAVSQAKQIGLINVGGGHVMAAGFSMLVDKFNDLQDFFNKRFASQLAEYHDNKILNIDTAISIDAINVDLVKSFDVIAPFGLGNPAPKLLIKNCYIIKSEIVGEKHIRTIIGDKLATNVKSIKAMCFNAVNNKLGDILLNYKGKEINIVGQARINNWYKEQAEFTIEDITL
ncbi:MAG: single-stranded-DNA-specific exonuclease RecJ [Pseudomonadota bacterium]